jgi:hypothetical protein
VAEVIEKIEKVGSGMPGVLDLTSLSDLERAVDDGWLWWRGVLGEEWFDGGLLTSVGRVLAALSYLQGVVSAGGGPTDRCWQARLGAARRDVERVARAVKSGVLIPFKPWIVALADEEVGL